MAAFDNEGARMTLERFVEDLGSTLLDFVVGMDGESRHVRDVVIFDPFDDEEPAAHSLILAVGVHSDEEIVDLLRCCAGRDVAAIMVKTASEEASPDVLDAVRDGDVVLLALNRGVLWNQLSTMLRTLMGDAALKVARTDASLPYSGDLFALANALTALVDAPVTIEDRNARVIAFSGRQEEADESRVETILGRAVPSRFTKILEDEGVFRQLYSSTGAIKIEADMRGVGNLARVAIAVRAGDEILGSIWVATHEDLGPDRLQALEDTAKFVALEMTKLRTSAHTDRRLRADLVGDAISGGGSAVEAIERLGIRDRSVVVMALAIVDEDERQSGAAAGVLAEKHRVGEALALHLSAVSSVSVAAVVGEHVIGIMSVPRVPSNDETSAVRIASNFLERVGGASRMVVGVGSTATDVMGLARSRDQAGRAVRVLRARASTESVARLRDLQGESLVLEMADAVRTRRELPAGPVARLRAYDAEHNTHLLETLSAWLEHFGDVASAAESVFAHTNTFRYRLRRAAELAEFDLDDPEARFSAMLHLRIWPDGLVDPQ